MQIPEKVLDIIHTLQENGYEGYAVGGCVRDRILGRNPGDWDITTSAKPEEVKRIFRKTIDTGIEHGTVTVMLDGEGFEVTTYRVDGEYKDHRHPTKVEYTPDLKEDLKRRDFTINAMAYNPEDGIVDLFDGVGDIERRCIRCVGEPKERFDEDALRMLRGIRFAAQLGFDIEEPTLHAMSELAPTIEKVSAERIRVEITKLLLAQAPEKILLAEQTGLCQYVLPEFSAMLQTKQVNPHHCYDVGNHCLEAVKQIQKLYQTISLEEFSQKGREFTKEKIRTILVYAALLHDVGKPAKHQRDTKGIDHFYGHEKRGCDMAKAILKRLRFDNDTIYYVTKLVAFHERRYQGKKELRRLVSQVGKEMMPYLFLLQEADIMAQSKYQREEKLARLREGKQAYCEVLQRQEAVSMKELEVCGNDLLELGIPAGPKVGQVLHHLLDIVLENPKANEKETLLKEAKEYTKG